MFPDNMEKWRNVGFLLLGGTLGFLLNPILWFSWLFVPWLAFLIATAAIESGFLADPTVTGEAQSRGMLQFNEDSLTLPFPLESFGLADWRLSPFWSGYAAAFYINAVMWSSPIWWTMAIPFYGVAIARWSWVHSTSEASARVALTDAWGEWNVPIDGFGPIHRNTYLVWHVLLCAPPTIILAISWAIRRK